MEEKQPLASNGAQDTHADWSTLVARAVGDVSRILHSETHLLQISLSAAVKAQIDYALAVFAMVAALIWAAICVLAALILPLQKSFQWWHGFPWWQAFAVGGLLCSLSESQSVESLGARPPLSSRHDRSVPSQKNHRSSRSSLHDMTALPLKKRAVRLNKFCVQHRL
jgi:hypothetical protein